MKYKTLFRMGLKLLGVYFVVLGGQGVLSMILQMAWQAWMEPQGSRNYLAGGWIWSVGSLWEIGCGLYLLLAGAWIADKAFPGNRPYCPECGYDASYSAGTTCVECGTVFPNDVIEQIKAMPPKSERKVV